MATGGRSICGDAVSVVSAFRRRPALAATAAMPGDGALPKRPRLTDSRKTCAMSWLGQNKEGEHEAFAKGLLSLPAAVVNKARAHKSLTYGPTLRIRMLLQATTGVVVRLVK